MTAAEVARRREQDLNRDNSRERLTVAQQRAREAYEEASHHANYGAAQH